MILGIDPGKNGGAAILSEQGWLQEAHSFRTPEDMHSKLLTWVRDFSIDTVIIERVHAFSGQGVVSAFSFGENYGWWLGRTMAMAGKDMYFVEPRAWQKALNAPLPGHARKTEHKNALCAVARSMFPDTRITLKTCDAILIAVTALTCIQAGTAKKM